MDVVKEINKLINYSPKRKTLFGQKLVEHDKDGGTIKPLCPTRWTVRTAALHSVLSQYQEVMEVMAEVNGATRDKYGLKAGGVLAALEKFSTFFGLRLGHLLFSASEETSKALQGKSTSIQEALSAVAVCRSFFQRQRTDEKFEAFYQATVELAEGHSIGQPQLPRNCRQPRRLDDGSQDHHHNTARDLYRQVYFEACDLLIGELTDRFDQQFVQPLATMENLIIKAANAEDFSQELEGIRDSVFAKDFDISRLQRNLAMLPDVMQQAMPTVKRVTSIRTVC